VREIASGHHQLGKRGKIDELVALRLRGDKSCHPERDNGAAKEAAT
jgi:hypothetical protein